MPVFRENAGTTLFDGDCWNFPLESAGRQAFPAPQAVALSRSPWVLPAYKALTNLRQIGSGSPSLKP